jgi:hypothetical protein
MAARVARKRVEVEALRRAGLGAVGLRGVLDDHPKASAGLVGERPLRHIDIDGLTELFLVLVDGHLVDWRVLPPAHATDVGSTLRCGLLNVGERGRALSATPYPSGRSVAPIGPGSTPAEASAACTRLIASSSLAATTVISRAGP